MYTEPTINTLCGHLTSDTGGEKKTQKYKTSLIKLGDKGTEEYFAIKMKKTPFRQKKNLDGKVIRMYPAFSYRSCNVP